jgi:hypothetical protein
VINSLALISFGLSGCNRTESDLRCKSILPAVSADVIGESACDPGGEGCAAWSRETKKNISFVEIK